MEESNNKKKRLAKLSLFHPVSLRPQVLQKTLPKHNPKKKKQRGNTKERPFENGS
jgi:hypothetical protein